MRTTAAAVGSSVFFAVAPGVVAGVVPWALTGWQEGDAPGWWLPVQVAGAVVLAGCAVVLVQAFVRFVREGRGTPAPVAPTERLVVGGLYRHVRNPMYVAVVGAILGQALLLARPVLVVYAAGRPGRGWPRSCAGTRSRCSPPATATSTPPTAGNVRAWLPRLRPWRSGEAWPDPALDPPGAAWAPSGGRHPVGRRGVADRVAGRRVERRPAGVQPLAPITSMTSAMLRMSSS